MSEPIVKVVEVACAPALAFDVFVNRIGSWWPLESKSASAASGQAAQDLVIEPYVGGAVVETMFDGTRNDWGKVLAFEEGKIFAMTWHPGSNTDRPTEVRVVFEPAGADRCKVTLTHSGWEVWAEKAEEMRHNYADGWAGLLETLFVEACETAL